MKLSIIVPIYKVEKYIIECIESIVVQLKPEYSVEIICVNDGTPDQSFCMLKEFTSKLDKNLSSKFLFIEQENKGLSEARNTGIKIAKGEYLAFLDSDDKLLSNFFTKILFMIDSNRFDILDFNAIDSNGNIINIRKSNNLNNIDSVFEASNWFAWARVYNRQLFSQNKFTSNIYYEDLDLVPILYLDSKCIIHVSEILYWYRVNPEGITHNVSPGSKEKTIHSLQVVLNNNLSRNINHKYMNYIIHYSFYMLCIYSCRLYGLKFAMNILRDSKTKIDKPDIFYSIPFLFFAYFPNLFIIIYYVFLVLKRGGGNESFKK